MASVYLSSPWADVRIYSYSDRQQSDSWSYVHFRAHFGRNSKGGSCQGVFWNNFIPVSIQFTHQASVNRKSSKPPSKLASILLIQLKHMPRESQKLKWDASSKSSTSAEPTSSSPQNCSGVLVLVPTMLVYQESSMYIFVRFYRKGH